MDIDTLRTVLIISLSLLVVIMLGSRFKQRIVMKDMPVILHAQVLALDVKYHPPSLRVHLNVPFPQLIRTRILDPDYRSVHEWIEQQLPTGQHVLERVLPELMDGSYYLEVRTITQRTVRSFRLQRA